MLPLPLAGNSTIAHCSRRDEALVPPLLPALVALLMAVIATMCAAVVFRERCAFPFALRALVHCPIRAQRRAFPFAKPV